MAWRFTRMRASATATGSSGRWASATREHGGKFEGGADRYRSRDLTDLVQTQSWRIFAVPANPTGSGAGSGTAPTTKRGSGGFRPCCRTAFAPEFRRHAAGAGPAFRFLVSRAVYKSPSLCRLAIRINVVQPLPVTSFAAEFTPDNRVRLSWQPAIDPLEPSAAPTAYVVYTRRR